MRRCPQCGTSYEDGIAFCEVDGSIVLEIQPPGEEDPRLGTQVGEYILAAKVADGGMGRVYEGRHVETKERVAVKVLHDQIAMDPVAVERLKREFETTEELEHRHIVSVIDTGQTNGSFYLTMEYLDGKELSKVLEERGTLPAAELVQVLIQLAVGLDYAHSFGMVHRDLKPENIFLTPQEEGGWELHLLDFGSVKLQMETGPKLTAIGTTLGSPYYMSPEQAMGMHDLDQRTDVFAVGAVAWELGTGKVAFGGKTVAEIITNIIQNEAPSALAENPLLPPAFDEAVFEAVAKEKTTRPSSVSAFVNLLLKAYGLTGDVAFWHERPFAELKAALESAEPPDSLIAQPTPQEVKGGPDAKQIQSATATLQWDGGAVSKAPEQQEQALHLDEGDIRPPARSKPPVWVYVLGLLMVAAVVVGLVLMMS